MDNKQYNLFFVDFCYAEQSGNNIYLHKDLEKDEYTYLREKLLKHELEHLWNKGSSFKDILHDLHDGFDFEQTVLSLKYILPRPRLISRMLKPFWFSISATGEKCFVYNPSMIFAWLFLFICFGTLYLLI